jgi:hypothetical protein
MVVSPLQQKAGAVLSGLCPETVAAQLERNHKTLPLIWGNGLFSLWDSSS